MLGFRPVLYLVNLHWEQWNERVKHAPVFDRSSGAIFTIGRDLRLILRLDMDTDRDSLETVTSLDLSLSHTKENHRDSLKSRLKSWPKSQFGSFLCVCATLFRPEPMSTVVTSSRTRPGIYGAIRRCLGLNLRWWHQERHLVFSAQYIRFHDYEVENICLKRLSTHRFCFYDSEFSYL